MKKVKSFFFISTFVIISFISFFVIDFFIFVTMPRSSNKRIIPIQIIPGRNLKDTAEDLFHANLIRNPLKFRLLARLKRYDTKIKAGEYSFSAAMSPNEILDLLVQGKVSLYKLTIPEGYNIHQIASLLSETGLCSKEKFLSAAFSHDLARDQGIDAASVEGYLFPETYSFPKGMTPEKIIFTMIKRFRTVFVPDWETQAKELGMTVHQAVTLASIIEKETGAAVERPIISSVFHNRLKKGMRLQSDPTVIYGINNFDGNITREHLRKHTPYNTYTIYGLPPGPIASPGLKAIEAALYPAETSYLYFVSKKDSTHQFSTNIKDHNLAVRNYQLRK